MRVAAIVLAAGEASRFGSPKQRLLLPRVLERLRRTSVDEIVVVEGAHELELPSDTASQGVGSLPCGRGRRARARRFAAGCGARAMTSRPQSSYSPTGLTSSPRAVERVLDDWREHGGVVAASYDGARGHPLVLGRADWEGIPDEGLRDRPVRLVPCDDLGAPGRRRHAGGLEL